MMPAVEARDLSRSHRTPHGTVVALDRTSVSFRSGEVTVVAGPSGSGKTTLLSLLGGLEAPSSGEILFEGRSLSSSYGNLTEYRLRSVGFVFQAHNLLPHLSALENVIAPMLLAGVRHRDAVARAGELLSSVGIGPDRWDHRPTRLSGGQQQRVAFARALANRPKLILADEPTGNLDGESSRQVFDLLERLAREMDICVVVVTHDTDLAARAARVIQLRDGKVSSDRRSPVAVERQ